MAQIYTGGGGVTGLGSLFDNFRSLPGQPKRNTLSDILAQYFGPTEPSSNPYMDKLESLVGGGKVEDSYVIDEVNSQYNPQIQALVRAQQLASAQTSQNVADIGSWFGQYGQQLRGTTRGNIRAGKKAAKGQAKFDRELLSGIADPNVAGAVGREAAASSRYIGRTNLGEERYDRRMESEAGRHEAYYKMVQQRLGAQQQSEIGAQLGSLRAARGTARRSAVASAGNDRFGQMLALANLWQGQQKDPLSVMGQQMNLLGGAQKMGLVPGAEAQADPNAIFGGLSQIMGTTDNYGEAMKRGTMFLEAMGLPQDRQTDDIKRLVATIMGLKAPADKSSGGSSGKGGGGFPGFGALIPMLP